MKFYLDEHINPAIGYGLKLRGFDAKTVQEEDMKNHIEFI